MFIDNVNNYKKLKCNSLVYFLKNKQIYYRFLNNLKKSNIKDWDTFNDFCKISKIKLILLSFDWKKTPEGYDYWNKINNQWLQFLLDRKSIKSINQLYSILLSRFS